MKINSELHNPIESKVAQEDLEILESIQDRVLWLSTRIVDYVNNDRPNVDGPPVDNAWGLRVAIYPKS